jgi:sugar lactone lactonase YvrE
MRTATRISAIFCFIVFLAPVVFPATITGSVKGPDGTPFMGAFVVAENTKNRVTVSVLSGKDGRYHIDSLPAGTYSFRIRAVGYQSDPQAGKTLNEKAKASFDFNLQPGIVRWTDLTGNQGRTLLPKGRGRDVLLQNCFICHDFQTRMASTTRDEAGWRDRVDYMRKAMSFVLGTRFTDARADDVVAYLTSTFGPDSTKPKSPADLPEYKDTVRQFSEQAMNIVYVEYDVTNPKGLPWSAAPDKDGNLWIPYYGRGNAVARLNPKTAELTTYPLPFDEAAGIHSVIPAPDGTVWFTELAFNRIAHLDPATKKITEYQDDGDVPGERPGKHTIRMDPSGNLWITGSPFTRFDATTKKFTHYLEAPNTYGDRLDNHGNMWFTSSARNKGAIGYVDAETGKLSQWLTPDKEPLQRIEVDSEGKIWFTGRTRKTIGVFDPKTETFKEIILPGPSPSPYPIAIDRDHYVWYNSSDQDSVGRIDPATGQVTEYPFPHSEGRMREFFLDSQGRIWYATPTNNRVGYFYLAKPS